MDSVTHYFDADTVSGWRMALESAWDDLPTPEVEDGWSLSSFDPAALLTAVDGVHLQEGFKLALYVYRWGRDGNGITWALPTAAPVPPAADCPLTAPPANAWTTARMADLTVPHPPSAVGDLSSVVEVAPGDASAHLRASLLLREWGELGAANHGQWWSDQAIIDTQSAAPDAPAEWEWKVQPVEDLRPQVAQTENGWQIVFYSVTAYGGWKMYAHEDMWHSGKALAKIRLVATAAGGNKR
jgi:hypothetical protein